MGDTWLRHVQMSSFYVRLFRPEKVRYERLVNPVTRVRGTTGRIYGYLNHFPFSKGVGWWISRHNDYSTKEAQQSLLTRATDLPLTLKALLSKDFQIRRKQQKALFYRLPGRPILKFLTLYIAKRGFLDGRPGLQYAILQSIYEYFIILKTKELENHTNAAAKEKIPNQQPNRN